MFFFPLGRSLTASVFDGYYFIDTAHVEHCGDGCGGYNYCRYSYCHYHYEACGDE